jgi:ligand-binding sensor domain-containing protein/signal transduction histidine kinase
MLPSFRSFVVSTLVVILLATGCFGAAFLAEGYSMRIWQTEDGLPQNMLTSAVQTRDGHLWFGTYSGLARFDGERFQIFEPANTPALPDRRVTRLFEDAHGTLWIGHDSGIVTRYQAGRFEPLPLPSGNIGDKIIGFGNDAHGRLWTMRENGILDSLDGATRIPSLIGADRPGVMSYSANAQGNMWLSENGRAARFVDGKLDVAELPLPLSNNYVLCVAAASDGGVWIICDNRIRKWNNGRWTEDRGEYSWQIGGVACALELRDGTLAIGTIEAGLHLVFPDGRRPVRLDRSNGLPQNWVRFLYEDREGNLWASAGSAGLVSIHATAFSVVPSPEETQGCSLLSVAAAPDGSLWIGTDGAGLYHYSGGSWKHYGRDNGLMNSYVPSVGVNTHGDVWASDFWWGGPYQLQQERFSRPDGIEESANPVYALLPLDNREWLVGNRDGLRLWKNGGATWLVKSPATSAPEVCAIARDREGVIWCGFASGGVARVADGRVTFFSRSEGLASDAVSSLSIDDENTVWVGTSDRGLSRFKNGRFATIGRKQGLVDDGICAILDDGHGYLWLSTHHGIQRIAKNDLNRCADGASATFPSHVYDRSDGLPVIDFTSGFQPVACKSPDGRLWFASSKGLVSVDPARIESNPIQPPVVIESMWRDGHAANLTNGLVVDRLPADHERLEFRFSGLSFVAPGKVLFKYRLDGIDGDWVDAGARRSAFYSRLPAGTYRFRVIACNNDGLWNYEGASVAFTVAPFFWQTWWFITAVLLVAAVTIAWFARLITRRRMQRKIEQMERAHELERERARIAQDIHDDVGASLSRIAMLSQPARGDLAEPERTAATLSGIFATAREVTRSLDEIVWAVDPRHDTLDSLVDYMGKFAQNLLGPAGLRCRLDLPVEVPAWPLTAEIRHNLFLAFKEALNNAVKHAAATEVRISVQLKPDSFVLELKDNGRGFKRPPMTNPAPPAAVPSDRIASGHGLPNMQARLARIGGRCEISTAAGGGTRVLFVIQVAKPADDPSTSSPS